LKEELLIKLAQLYQNELGVGPFPLEQARKVARTKDWEGFHSCLTTYLPAVAGIASHGKQLKKITAERRQEFKRTAAKAFFEKYPEYLYIEERLQNLDVPRLKRLLDTTEQARLLIVAALAED
jgi:hypothetical protein